MWINVIFGLILAPLLCLPERSVAQHPNPILKTVPQMGHDGIGSVVVKTSADGKWMTTSCADNTARLWELLTGREVRVFQGEVICATALAENGKWLATGDRDGLARLWSVSDGTIIQAFKHNEPVKFISLSSDCKLLITVTVDEQELECKTHVFSLDSGKKSSFKIGSAKTLKSVAFGSDGKWMAIASGDNTARLWDVYKGQETRVFAHDSEVLSVDISCDGQWLTTGGQDGIVCLWQGSTGKLIQQYKGHTGPVNAVRFSKKKDTLVTGSKDKSARTWETNNAKQLRVFLHPTPVSSVAFARDGRTVVAGGENGTFSVWDATNGKNLFLSESRVDMVMGFVGSAQQLITFNSSMVNNLGDGKGKARLWDLVAGKEKIVFWRGGEELNLMTLSNDGKWLVTSKDKEIFLWDLQKEKKVRTLDGHKTEVVSLALSSDGKWLMSRDLGGTAYVWDTESGKRVRELPASRTNDQILSDDGKKLLTYDLVISGNAVVIPEINLFDVHSGKKIRTHANFELISFMAVTTDWQWLATANACDDNSAALWELSSGKLIRTFRGHNGSVTSIAISRDKKWLVTSSDDFTVRLWDPRTGKEVRVYRGHTRKVTFVVINDAATRLITGSWDRTVRVWDLSSGKEICRMFSFLDGTWAVIDSEGRYDASSNGDINGLEFVDFKDITIPVAVKDRCFDPGLLAKHLGFSKERLRKIVAQENR